MDGKEIHWLCLSLPFLFLPASVLIQWLNFYTLHSKTVQDFPSVAKVFFLFKIFCKAYMLTEFYLNRK